ncbi:hypothetical protein [Billgrantia endophytica]|uniref:Uncharacterized protein n=1 Tax=Billgrantia endophytica TaxID=2033802 RepID=A0A2N7U0Z6_9GAMM|nr:hypothetical protein [Halomonas endophytica]PMR74108.1 hypothetical protein C1H69_14770 [Halomonas endophytica]
MQDILLPLAMATTFGAFTGSLFRLTRRPGYERPFMFPVVGLIAGLTAYLIFHVLASTTGAPAWLLPVLVVLQVWLWLGPFGPKFRKPENGDESR